MLNNHKFFKHTTFALLIIITSNVFAQIPNAGFESWHSSGFPSYNDPDNWGTLNSSTSIIGVYTAEKATGAGNYHSGSASIKLSTHYISFASQTAPGIAATGSINTNTEAIDGGFAYTSRPIAITGWFKGTPAAHDSGSVEVDLWHWNGTTRVPVGSVTFYSSATVSSFTHFFAPIVYTSPSTPDSAVIILSSSDTNNPVDGSVFYVDDLLFVDCSGFSATVTTTNATCTSHNGSATVNYTGGTNPVSFLWSNSTTNSTAFNLAAGAYHVVVSDANGCSATASATVSANITPITVTADSTQSSCASNTGSVTATTTDGAQPYTYLWSNNSTTSTVTNLGAGTYSVTITDSNGCTGAGTTSVTTPNGPSATAVVTNVSCYGELNGAINLTVTGGTTPITYSWSNGATIEDLSNLSIGSYCVTITDGNGCLFQRCDSVGQPDSALSASSVVTNATTPTSNDGSITLTTTGGTAPYTITWNPNGDGTNLSAGVYSYTVADANGCTVSGLDTVTALSTGIRNISDEKIKLYPNPASSEVTIETNSPDGKFIFSVYDLQGRLAEEKMIAGNKINVSVKNIEEGFYTYQLKNISSGEVGYGKLQIER